MLAASDTALAALITGIGTISVAMIGAIAALSARATVKRTETRTRTIDETTSATAESVTVIDDAVNNAHLTDSPRLFDLVRRNTEDLVKLHELVERRHRADERVHQQIIGQLQDHVDFEEKSKWPELEAGLRSLLDEIVKQRPADE